MPFRVERDGSSGNTVVAQRCTAREGLYTFTADFLC